MNKHTLQSSNHLIKHTQKPDKGKLLVLHGSKQAQEQHMLRPRPQNLQCLIKHTKETLTHSMAENKSMTSIAYFYIILDIDLLCHLEHVILW